MSARLIQVIETDLQVRGNGKEDPYRLIKQYWSLEGELLAEVDPTPKETISWHCGLCGKKMSAIEKHCPSCTPKMREYGKPDN